MFVQLHYGALDFVQLHYDSLAAGAVERLIDMWQALRPTERHCSTPMHHGNHA